MTLSKLSPQARKALRKNKSDVKLRATVELAPGKSPENILLASECEQVEVLSWSAQSHLMTLLIDSGKLADLAKDTSVTYVQVGDKMRH